MKSEYQREELDAEYKRGYMDGKAAGMKLVEENEELFKVGDVVFNSNNYRYAVILQLRSDGHSATVAEYHPEREDKILVHTPPLAALLKEEGRHIGIIEELRTQGGES